MLWFVIRFKEDLYAKSPKHNKNQIDETCNYLHMKRLGAKRNILNLHTFLLILKALYLFYYFIGSIYSSHSAVNLN